MSPAMGRAQGRLDDYRHLGASLLALVREQAWGFAEELGGMADSLLEQAVLNRARRSGVSGAALCGLSLLFCSSPLQLPGGQREVMTLADQAYEWERLAPEKEWAGKRASLVPGNPALRNAFPLKQHPGASTKVNIYLEEVCDELRAMGEWAWAAPALEQMAGRVYSDQATNALLYGYCLRHAFGVGAVKYAVAAVLMPQNAKGLSVALKALGLNGTRWGAMLCEGDVLQGRAVGSANLLEEAKARCDPIKAGELILDHYAEEEMRAAIREILAEELPVDDLPEFDDLATFWNRRWVWGVNGAHNRTLERHTDGKVVPVSQACPGVSRYYRRMFLEANPTEVISSWDGTTFVTASEKLECGKTRPLFACDSRSYCAFEHLLGPVQEKWRNRHVILDPGHFGHLGMARKVLACRQRGGTNLMLDFDAFNEHHSLRSQKILFEETMRHCRYPEHLRQRLLDSFDKQHIYVNGKLVGTAVGTLMSGHRGTTYVNSCLNRAYLRLALGPEILRQVDALHVGDDIYMCTPTIRLAGEIVEKCRRYGCRMNPSKQSIGQFTAEFLRVAIRPEEAWGYLCRGIASAVAGNWVNEAKLSPREALANGIATARTLINRSGGVVGVARLLKRSYARMARIRHGLALNLLRGAVGLKGSPVWASGGSVVELSVVEDAGERFAEAVERLRWPLHATKDYLSKGCSYLERLMLERTGGSVISAMADSSYRKALLGEVTQPRRIRLRRERCFTPRGSANAVHLLHQPVRRGVLEGYPLLHLIRSRMDEAELRLAVGEAGGDPHAADIEAEAWGSEAHAVVVDGVLPFSDAATLARRTREDVLYCLYPVRV